MYDVIVIGCGPGGYAAAIRASQLGGKVAVVEAGDIGGTCVNRGCIPTKVWLRAAYLLHRIREGADFGIKAPVQEVDLGAIVERKNGVAGEIRMGMEALLTNNGVDLLRGHGHLRSPRQVEVEGKVLECKSLILATGSSLKTPDIPGLKEAAWTTDRVLNMDRVPSSALVWGEGGPIELEMATLLNSFGSSVHLATHHARILPGEDAETSQRITQAYKEQGVKVYRRSTLESVSHLDNGFEVRFSGPEQQVMEVEVILLTARSPNTANLGLEKLGIRLNDDGSTRVSETLETAVKGVYAIGDATGGRMSSHAASAMGVTAAENAMGKANRFPFHLIPRGIWTFPQVGAVGLSEEEAEKRGYEVEVGDFPNSINGLAMCHGEVDGAVKIVSDAEYGDVLGIHIVGANATELIGEAVLALQLECTADMLARSIRVHPTFSETIMDAGRDASHWALYLPRR